MFLGSYHVLAHGGGGGGGGAGGNGERGGGRVKIIN